jgi:hypothetical protein
MPALSKEVTMRKLVRVYFGVVFGILFLVLMAKPDFAQQEAVLNVAASSTDPEIQWVLGEVISTDTANNKLVVKFLDYEAEIEREITVEAAGDTVYEGTTTLADIKPKDTVSIDYIAQDEKNIAKKVSVQKTDTETPEDLLTEEITPNMEAGEAALNKE